VEGRVYKALVAPPTMVVRSREQQLPDPKDKVGRAILEAIHRHFYERPTDFEQCTVVIWRMIAPGTGKCYPTRPRRCRDQKPAFGVS
jgi:hypothetical protein